jgi:hypothetical protein
VVSRSSVGHRGFGFQFGELDSDDWYDHGIQSIFIHHAPGTRDTVVRAEFMFDVQRDVVHLIEWRVEKIFYADQAVEAKVTPDGQLYFASVGDEFNTWIGLVLEYNLADHTKLFAVALQCKVIATKERKGFRQECKLCALSQHSLAAMFSVAQRRFELTPASVDPSSTRANRPSDRLLFTFEDGNMIEVALRRCSCNPQLYWEGPPGTLRWQGRLQIVVNPPDGSFVDPSVRTLRRFRLAS